MAEKEGQAGAKLTSRMVRAGMDAYLETYRESEIGTDEVVIRIYEAMTLERSKGGSRSTQSIS